MKLTSVCYRGHNLYRLIRSRWFFQSKKALLNTPMRDILQREGIKVHEAAEVMQEAPIRWRERVKTIGPCLFYRDRNVLVEGLNQAKVFTNAVEIENGLPEPLLKIKQEIDTAGFEESIQMAVASAVVYDTTQKKLPKRKNPENPAWNYPRDYGINDSRKNYIICNRFLQLCEMIASSDSKNKCKVLDAFFSLPLIRDRDTIQLELRADLLVLAVDPIKPLASAEVTSPFHVPNIDPMKYTISLDEEYFYELKNSHPLKTKNALFKHPHTALIHYNETEVRNLHGSPVTEDQIVARSLMKSFTIAAAQARYLYGDNVEELPEPVVVQCIQTDAKYFHFSVFQLNTLRWPPDSTTLRNIFWHDSMMPTYEFAGYYDGRPTISSYNSDVFKTFLAFYKHS